MSNKIWMITAEAREEKKLIINKVSMKKMNLSIFGMVGVNLITLL